MYFTFYFTVDDGHSASDCQCQRWAGQPKHARAWSPQHPAGLAEWSGSVTSHSRNSPSAHTLNLQRTDFPSLLPTFQIYFSNNAGKGQRVLPIPALIPLLLPTGNPPSSPHLLPTLTTNFRLFCVSLVHTLHDSITQTPLRPKKQLHMAVKTINQLFFLTNDECSTTRTGTYTFSAGTLIFRVVKWVFTIGT